MKLVSRGYTPKYLLNHVSYHRAGNQVPRRARHAADAAVLQLSVFENSASSHAVSGIPRCAKRHQGEPPGYF